MGDGIVPHVLVRNGQTHVRGFGRYRIFGGVAEYFIVVGVCPKFVQAKLVQPAVWMGRGGDWEIVAMERGNLGVRLLYKLSAIPDLSEKYSPEEDE